MFAKARVVRVLLLLGVALGGVAGCLLVSPLDGLPAAGGKDAGGKSAGGKSAGGTSAASSGDSLGGAVAGEAGAGASAGESSSGRECETNLECFKKKTDQPARCRPSDHTCVLLRSPTCTLNYGDGYKDPNAIYFGAFAPFNPNAPGDSTVIWSQRLALDELSGDNLGGLPDPRRPLVMIVCNNADDAVEEGVAHLADELQVPAMIANLQPGALRKAYQDHPDIFYLTPVTVTNVVATWDDDDKIWGLLGQPADLAPAYAALVKLQEKRWDPAQHPGEKLKVALVSTNAAFDGELASAVEAVLRFNDDTLALDNGANYLNVKLDADDPQLDEHSRDIIAFRPDVILSAASGLFSMDKGLLETIEVNWDGDQTDIPRPFYVLSPYNTGDLSNIAQLMGSFIKGKTDLNPELRFVGVSVADARDNKLQKAYEDRLRPLFPDAEPDSANYYDAMYFLAYAMYGAGTDAPLSGASIAKGMRRLLDGDTSYAIGPKLIQSTFGALGAGSNVHVLSTLGPPDFDAKTGVRPVEASVLCFDNMGTYVVPHRNVLRYDRDLGALTGIFPCFSGFFE
jgi:hypothetical protein